VRYEARPIFVLVTQITGNFSCQEMSNLIGIFRCLLIFVSSSPVLKLNKFGAFGEINAKLAIELHIANSYHHHHHQSILHFIFRLSRVRQKLDGEVTEVLRQEWSYDHTKVPSSQPYTLSNYQSFFIRRLGKFSR
jgi:hypothetical protein